MFSYINIDNYRAIVTLVGFEPTTFRFVIGCSIRAKLQSQFEREMGFEPIFAAPITDCCFEDNLGYSPLFENKIIDILRIHWDM